MIKTTCLMHDRSPVVQTAVEGAAITADFLVWAEASPEKLRDRERRVANTHASENPLQVVRENREVIDGSPLMELSLRLRPELAPSAYHSRFWGTCAQTPLAR